MLFASSGGRIPNPEVVFALVALPLAAAGACLGWRWLGWWERPLARLARKRGPAVVVAAALPLLLRAALLPWFPAPQPRVHDEFTLLLAADTLAHGRLANPQHLHWVHFETIHVLAQPTYASAFPLAHAAAMAVGQVIMGQAWAGVWLGVALMCGAICWMLQGWLPPRWALLGAILIGLRLGVSSYWMNSYWGGAVAAAGGALVLGALPRIIRLPHWRPAAVMGVGLAILANSRPFEGGIFGLAVAVPLFSWMLGKRAPARPVALVRILLPLAAILGLTAAGMAYDFARVTGKPWLMPYVLYRNTMSVVPHFLWQKPGPEPIYNNAEMRDFYEHWEMNNYETARSGLVRHLWNAVEVNWRFYIGPLLSVPLLALPLAWRDGRVRQLLWMGMAFSLALLGQVWHIAHYAAPATGLVILMVLLCMRRLRLWSWHGRPVGRDLVRCLPPACAAVLLFQMGAGPVAAGLVEPPGWRWPSPGGVARAAILRGLENAPRKHLVLVRYDRFHDPGDEWVYNGADIDASRVVWARELDPASNEALIRYFGDRRVWLVEPDFSPPLLRAYRDAPFRPMFFVPLGAPGIEVLRSVETVRRKVLEKAGDNAGRLLGCHGWNYYFTEATGVLGPDPSQGCSDGGGSLEAVRFDDWFSWLQRQR